MSAARVPDSSVGGVACLAAAVYGQRMLYDMPRKLRSAPQAVEDPLAEEPVALAD